MAKDGSFVKMRHASPGKDARQTAPHEPIML